MEVKSGRVGLLGGAPSGEESHNIDVAESVAGSQAKREERLVPPTELEERMALETCSELVKLAGERFERCEFCGCLRRT